MSEFQTEIRTADSLRRCYWCAVERRFLQAGANPAQQLSLQLVAAERFMEVTTWVEALGEKGRLGRFSEHAGRNVR